MIDYLSVSVNEPPLDTKILVKKDSDAFVFDDSAKIIFLESKQASKEWHVMSLLSDGFTLWAAV